MGKKQKKQHTQPQEPQADAAGSPSSYRTPPPAPPIPPDPVSNPTPSQPPAPKPIPLTPTPHQPIPDPTDPLKDEEDWDNEAKYVITNAQGVVILRDAIVGIEYAFYTYDEGSRQWLTKNLKIKEGKNEIKFVVNK